MRILVTLLSTTATGLAGAPLSSAAAGVTASHSAAAVGPDALVDAGWEKLLGTHPPDGRAQHAMVWDAGRAEMIMFGGYEADAPSPGLAHGTWAWDGTQWRKLATKRNPPLRGEHSMAYDPVRDEIVLYGGSRITGDEQLHHRDDTWVFADGDWTRRRPSETPDHVENASMAYDPHLQQLIMFGGFRPEGFGGDIIQETWTWDGLTWRELDPKTKPPLRENAGLAFDPARGRLVLFGGAQFGSSERNDTWTWDGTTWEEVQTTAAPPIRANAGMSTFGDEVVVFGGDNITGNLDDTWVLHGSEWEQLKSEPAPRARVQTGLEWDPVRNEAVLFGGRAGSWFNDTWTLTPTG